MEVLSNFGPVAKFLNLTPALILSCNLEKLGQSLSRIELDREVTIQLYIELGMYNSNPTKSVLQMLSFYIITVTFSQ